MEKFLDVQDPKLSQFPTPKSNSLIVSHKTYTPLPHKKRGATAPLLLIDLTV